MNRNILSWIALRYFKSKKRTGLISFTSYISITGIALGTFALVVALSVLNGFESEITNRVVNLESHLRITGNKISEEDLTLINEKLNRDNLRSVAPFVIRKSIISNYGSEGIIRVKGIQPPLLSSLFRDESNIVRGDKSFEVASSNLPGILIGFRLADKLGAYIGDTLRVINPLDVGSRFDVPVIGKFVLSGIFRLDIFDYDENLAFIDLNEGQRIFKLDGLYSGIDIRFNEYRHIEHIAEKLKEKLPAELNVMTWEDLHKSLFGAMKLEKYGSFITLCLIILVAIFNLTSSLVMLVMEKIREIGMLQTLGLSRTQVKGIFLRLGVITGSIGLSFGLLLSLPLCILQSIYKFIPLPAVYFIPYLPVEVHFLDVLFVVIACLLLVFISTIYPSWRVGELIPVEAIQYEK